jgi:hypothetical protein
MRPPSVRGRRCETSNTTATCDAPVPYEVSAMPPTGTPLKRASKAAIVIRPSLLRTTLARRSVCEK